MVPLTGHRYARGRHVIDGHLLRLCLGRFLFLSTLGNSLAQGEKDLSLQLALFSGSPLHRSIMILEVDVAPASLT